MINLAEYGTILVVLGPGNYEDRKIPGFELSEIGTPDAFYTNPATTWEYYSQRRKKSLNSLPNAYHIIIAQLLITRCPSSILVLSTAIDNMCERATRFNYKNSIVKLHGDLFSEKCTSFDCLVTQNSYDIYENKTIPSCPACHGILRPNVVWYGEPLSIPSMNKADSFIESNNIDLVLFANIQKSDFQSDGSISLWPAMGFVERAVSKGAKILNLNDILDGLCVSPNFSLPPSVPTSSTSLISNKSYPPPTGFFLSLPHEVIKCILDHLDYSDKYIMAQTCSYVRNLFKIDQTPINFFRQYFVGLNLSLTFDLKLPLSDLFTISPDGSMFALLKTNSSFAEITCYNILKHSALNSLLKLSTDLTCNHLSHITIRLYTTGNRIPTNIFLSADNKYLTIVFNGYVQVIKMPPFPLTFSLSLSSNSPVFSTQPTAINHTEIFFQAQYPSKVLSFDLISDIDRPKCAVVQCQRLAGITVLHLETKEEFTCPHFRLDYKVQTFNCGRTIAFDAAGETSLYGIIGQDKQNRFAIYPSNDPLCRTGANGFFQEHKFTRDPFSYFHALFGRLSLYVPEEHARPLMVPSHYICQIELRDDDNSNCSNQKNDNNVTSNDGNEETNEIEEIDEAEDQSEDVNTNNNKNKDRGLAVYTDLEWCPEEWDNWYRSNYEPRWPLISSIFKGSDFKYKLNPYNIENLIKCGLKSDDMNHFDSNSSDPNDLIYIEPPSTTNQIAKKKYASESTDEISKSDNSEISFTRRLLDGKIDADQLYCLSPSTTRLILYNKDKKDLQLYSLHPFSLQFNMGPSFSKKNSVRNKLEIPYKSFNLNLEKPLNLWFIDEYHIALYYKERIKIFTLHSCNVMF